jgi:hypothetical protein
MFIKCIPATLASVLVFVGGLSGTAQEPTGRWDSSSETRPILSVKAGGVGRSSIELHLNEPVRLVVTPTFRDPDDLCVSSLQFGFDPTVLDRAPAAWLIEARLVELRQAEATLDLKWTRRVNRADLSPGGSFTSEQRIDLREGDSRILDLIRAAHPTSTGCESFGLTYEWGLEGARTLSDAAIAYDLWLVQQDADGELVTDRYKVTAKQGQQVDYFFKPLPYTADGRRSDNGTTAILMNVSGAIRGRVRTDGNIDLTVDGSRFFTDAAATAATASHGRTVLTVKPGETVEVLSDLPIPGRLSKFGDLNGIFGKHRTAVRITAKRLW